uniref:Uncharacterized protein n=1 Tax=Arundo donax TaxID=35708 RepID=A0A0A9DTE1_ARUDO
MTHYFFIALLLQEEEMVYRWPRAAALSCRHRVTAHDDRSAERCCWSQMSVTTRSLQNRSYRGWFMTIMPQVRKTSGHSGRTGKLSPEFGTD